MIDTSWFYHTNQVFSSKLEEYTAADVSELVVVQDDNEAETVILLS